MNYFAFIAPAKTFFTWLHRTRVRGSVALLLVLLIPAASWALRSFWPKLEPVPGETRIEYRSDPLEADYIEKLERDLERERNKPAKEIRFPAPPPETLIERRFLVPRGLTLATCPVSSLSGTPLLETGRDWLRMTTFDEFGTARQFEYTFRPKLRRWGAYAGFELDSPYDSRTVNDAFAHSTAYVNAWVRVWRFELYAEPYLDFSLLDGRGVGVLFGGRYRIR